MPQRQVCRCIYARSPAMIEGEKGVAFRNDTPYTRHHPRSGTLP